MDDVPPPVRPIARLPWRTLLQAALAGLTLGLVARAAMSPPGSYACPGLADLVVPTLGGLVAPGAIGLLAGALAPRLDTSRVDGLALVHHLAFVVACVVADVAHITSFVVCAVVGLPCVAASAVAVLAVRRFAAR